MNQEQLLPLLKHATVWSSIVTAAADFAGEYWAAIVGLGLTFMFGMLGLAVSIHFKRKELNINAYYKREEFIAKYGHPPNASTQQAL